MSNSKVAIDATKQAKTNGGAADQKANDAQAKQQTEAEKQGWSPIHEAAFKGFLNAVRRFVETATDRYSQLETFTKDDQQATPLLLAALSSNLDIFKYLYEAGANLNAKNSMGHSCVEIAIMKQDMQLLEYIIIIDKQHSQRKNSVDGESANDLASRLTYSGGLANESVRRLKVWPRMVKLIQSDIDELSSCTARAIELLTTKSYFEQKEANILSRRKSEIHDRMMEKWIYNCNQLMENDILLAFAKIVENMFTPKETLISAFLVILNLVEHGLENNCIEFVMDKFLRACQGFNAISSICNRFNSDQIEFLTRYQRILRKLKAIQVSKTDGDDKSVVVGTAFDEQRNEEEDDDLNDDQEIADIYERRAKLDSNVNDVVCLVGKLLNTLSNNKTMCMMAFNRPQHVESVKKLVLSVLKILELNEKLNNDALILFSFIDFLSDLHEFSEYNYLEAVLDLELNASKAKYMQNNNRNRGRNPRVAKPESTENHFSLISLVGKLLENYSTQNDYLFKSLLRTVFVFGQIKVETSNGNDKNKQPALDPNLMCSTIKNRFISQNLSKYLKLALKNDSDEIKKLAIKCISTYSEANNYIKNVFFEQGLSEILVSSLNRYRSNGTNTAILLNALWSLALDEEEEMDHAQLTSPPTAATTTQNSYKYSNNSQYSQYSMMTSILESENRKGDSHDSYQRRKAISESISLDIINELLFCKEISICGLSCEILKAKLEQPATRSRSVHEEFIKTGNLRQLVKILTNEDEKSLLSAMRCIQRLCHLNGLHPFWKAQVELREANCLNYLIVIFNNYKKELLIAESAICLAYFCLENKENLKIIKEKFDFSYLDLFKLIKSRHHSIQLKATQALGIFSYRNPKEQSAILSGTGSLSFNFFRNIINSTTKSHVKCECAFQAIILAPLIVDQEPAKSISYGLEILFNLFTQRSSWPSKLEILVAEKFGSLTKLKNGVCEAIIDIDGVASIYNLLKHSNNESVIANCAISLSNISHYNEGRIKLLNICRKDTALFERLKLYNDFEGSKHCLSELFIKEWHHFMELTNMTAN